MTRQFDCKDISETVCIACWSYDAFRQKFFHKSREACRKANERREENKDDPSSNRRSDDTR